MWEGRLVNKKKDGTLYEEEATIAPVRDATGATVAYVAVKHDVTERERLTREMRQAQKMEAIGRLAGGVAHDFNNLLTIINGYAQMTLSKLNATATRSAAGLERIRQAGKRAAGLTQQMLAFSRKQVLQPVVLELNELVTETELMLQRVIGEDVHVETNLADDLAQVTADPGQMVQVIMNLAVNARDAMPYGGRTDDQDGQRNPRRGVRPGTPRAQSRALRSPIRRRHGCRHGPGDAVADLRAVLHIQGTRRGDRAGSLDCVRHRQAERRAHRRRERPRPREHVHGLPPSAGGGGRAGYRIRQTRGRTGRGPEAEPRPCW